MRKKRPFVALVHFSLIVFMSLALMIDLESSANPLPKKVKGTICCKDGSVVGASNDCVEGEGDCVDHNCKTGETEEPTVICPVIGL